jgi:protein-tyrosine phosphatase
MSDRLKAAVALGLMLGVAAWSYFFYRATYNHAKRLRVVQPGRFYRCGQLTADGFADAVKRLGIRTVVNVQDDVPDPAIWRNYVDHRVRSEKEVCARLGIRYVWLAPDLVPPDAARRGERPVVIDQFVRLCDDPSAYPILLHCKAGLHRTGILSAIYRMEYQGWPRLEAFRELRAHGFGDWVSTSANLYVDQYVLRYQPRRSAEGRAQNAE